MTESVEFRLDPVNECLWRRTASGQYERVLLTRAEFGVLDHLVENAGRLVTQREILDAVWPRTAIEPQAVKNKVFHLRRALDDDPKRPRYIETLSRRGYRFVGKIERGGIEDVHVPPRSARLVGRDGALTELLRHVRAAAAGRLQTIFVTGEAGIGKTALTEELQRQITASGLTMRVARGQCVEGFASREAFYPVLEAVGELCRSPDAARVVETLAGRAPTWLVQFPALMTRQYRETLQQEMLGATRERMLREICEALEAIAAPKPLLLVLEDLHWGDPSTLDLISALARRHGPARIMVVATYRPSDVARSAEPLRTLKRDLVARHLCREIALQPLSEAEVGEYLAGRQPRADVPPELASLLHRHTEGNPLFMIAVLEHLVESGLVARDHEAWRLLRPAAEISLVVPDSLRQMIGAQIEQLGENEQRVLEVAAIVGMSFAPAICAPSADIDVGDFDECCDSLARRGHMLRRAGTRTLPDGRVVQRYAFVHTLYREVLYERQAPARRAMLHRRRAERLEEVFA
ncbi:MAG TPA: AAA family ATPase, partial [Gemmatimonadaceae bacterium]|nr:AAA family ATPase [Gemmatimonadaceae bacterium]